MGSPSSVRANFKKYYEWSRRLYGVNYQNCPFDIIDLKTTEFFNYGTVAGADYYSSQIPDCSGGNPSYYSQNKEDKAIFSREYYIDNKVSRLALNGAFTIFWFIEGDKTRINKTNPKDYVLLPTLAGLSHVFAAPVEGCANCEEQAEEDLIIRNTKPISSLLLDYVEVGQLASFDPEHVVPFLQERLDWRIVKVRVAAETHPLALLVLICAPSRSQASSSTPPPSPTSTSPSPSKPRRFRAPKTRPPSTSRIRRSQSTLRMRRASRRSATTQRPRSAAL